MTLICENMNDSLKRAVPSGKGHPGLIWASVRDVGTSRSFLRARFFASATSMEGFRGRFDIGEPRQGLKFHSFKRVTEVQTENSLFWRNSVWWAHTVWTKKLNLREEESKVKLWKGSRWARGQGVLRTNDER